jgi:transcriptional regulator with XRE-family HTH domain
VTGPLNARRQLAEDLKYLRVSAQLTERKLAELLGVTQAWINRQEQGHGTTARSVKPQLIEAWAEATNADANMRSRLRVLVDAVLRNDQSWRERLGDRTHLQDEMREREAASRIIRNFQPTIVPGLLQTPEYAHFVIPLADIEGVIDHQAAAAGRLQRQQALFTDERRFEFLIGEAALRWPASQPQMLAAQLDRIATLASLASVHIAVLPHGEPATVVPWSNFIIFEGNSPFVSIELAHHEDPIADEKRVNLYRDLYSKMWQRALTGSEAVALIRRIADEYRRLK